MAKKKKSGKKPVQTTKPVKKINPNLPNGWFYMSTKDIDVGNLQESVSYETEIWREAGILEVIIEPKVSIDIETCDLDLGDDFSNDFLASNGIKSLFYVTIRPESYDQCILAVKEILSAHGGMLCGDTDDFTPVIK